MLLRPVLLPKVIPLVPLHLDLLNPRRRTIPIGHYPLDQVFIFLLLHLYFLLIYINNVILSFANILYHGFEVLFHLLYFKMG